MSIWYWAPLIDNVNTALTQHCSPYQCQRSQRYLWKKFIGNTPFVRSNSWILTMVEYSVDLAFDLVETNCFKIHPSAFNIKWFEDFSIPTLITVILIQMQRNKSIQILWYYLQSINRLLFNGLFPRHLIYKETFLLLLKQLCPLKGKWRGSCQSCCDMKFWSMKGSLNKNI